MRKQFVVAPHAGAWIETVYMQGLSRMWNVAPHAGAWIETGASKRKTRAAPVAPHAGAWIETIFSAGTVGCTPAWIETPRAVADGEPGGRRGSRTPRGCVD